MSETSRLNIEIDKTELETRMHELIANLLDRWADEGHILYPDDLRAKATALRGESIPEPSDIKDKALAKFAEFRHHLTNAKESQRLSDEAFSEALALTEKFDQMVMGRS